MVIRAGADGGRALDLVAFYFATLPPFPMTWNGGPEVIVDATADLPGSLRLGLFLLLLLQDHAVDNKVEAGSFCIGGGAFIKRVPYLFVDSRALVFFVLVLLTTGLFRCGDSFLFFVVVFKMHVFDLLLKTCHLPLRFSLVVWPPPGDRGRFLIRRNNL